jgi:mono/diheme cytochrome c family protein
MLKNLTFAAIAVLLAAGIGYADQSAGTGAGKVTVTVGRTPASSGKLMYASYCASCHGVDGRGAGPAATALKMRPADLTVLSRNNRGKFPATQVVSVLQFGVATPAHGSAEMPVWGPIFGVMSPGLPEEEKVRISNLRRYLESIQLK